jgi:hypothetical protein
MAISAMTITAERAAAVQFSIPFLQLRLGILLKFETRPFTKPTTNFLFLQPMELSLWFTFIIGLVVLLGVLYAVERTVARFSSQSREREAKAQKSTQINICAPR